MSGDVGAEVAAVLAILPTGEQFEARRRQVRAVYSSAIDSGYLLGTIDAQEELANKVRGALDSLAPLIAARVEAAQAEAWDRAHNEFCEYAGNCWGGRCVLHENPYRAAALDPEEES